MVTYFSGHCSFREFSMPLKAAPILQGFISSGACCCSFLAVDDMIRLLLSGSFLSAFKCRKSSLGSFYLLLVILCPMRSSAVGVTVSNFVAIIRSCLFRCS